MKGYTKHSIYLLFRFHHLAFPLYVTQEILLLVCHSSFLWRFMTPRFGAQQMAHLSCFRLQRVCWGGQIELLLLLPSADGTHFTAFQLCLSTFTFHLHTCVCGSLCSANKNTHDQSKPAAFFSLWRIENPILLESFSKNRFSGIHNCSGVKEHCMGALKISYLHM